MLLDKAANDPPAPFEPFEALIPSSVIHITMADLSPDELIIERLLPDHRHRSRAGDEGTGMPKFMYRPGWGPRNKSRPTSRGYISRAAMVRAIYEWAGYDWTHRVKHKSPHDCV